MSEMINRHTKQPPTLIWILQSGWCRARGMAKCLDFSESRRTRRWERKGISENRCKHSFLAPSAVQPLDTLRALLRHKACAASSLPEAAAVPQPNSVGFTKLIDCELSFMAIPRWGWSRCCSSLCTQLALPEASSSGEVVKHLQESQVTVQGAHSGGASQSSELLPPSV